LPPLKNQIRGFAMTKPAELSPQDQWKKTSAVAAASLVETGMVVGLGTGSTAAFVVAELGRRTAEEGLRIVGIPTSERTAEQARSLNIPLTTFARNSQIDLTIDGADEVELGSLYLVKGHGGALLREKIVAAASKHMAVIADDTKLVKHLGTRQSVPVEVVPFGWEATERKLKELGSTPKLRPGADGKPFVTDGGHYIIDCTFGPIKNPKELAHHLDHVVGVVEHGLFLDLAWQVFIGGPSGVKILKKQSETRGNKSTPRSKKRKTRR
jgi:ribose 5-phosphate isomerase A